MKTLTIRQFAAVKRVAQNVNPLVVKKNKLAAKIVELTKDVEALEDEIRGHEMGVKSITGGITSEDLITRKVEDTGKVDKDGKPIKVTKYEPKEGVVTFNEETNMYEINCPTLEEVPPRFFNDVERVSEVEVKSGEESPFNPLDLMRDSMIGEQALID